MNLAAAPERLDDGVVSIRRPRVEDAEAMAAAVQASLTELQHWLHWVSPAYDPEAARQRIRETSVDWPRGPVCQFLIGWADDGGVIGSVGLDVRDARDDLYELGWWVRSDATGRGVARRAARLAAGFAFEHLGAGRLDIIAARDNLASQKVARALGAIEEGVLRGRILVRGRRQDGVIFGLLPEDLASPSQ